MNDCFLENNHKGFNLPGLFTVGVYFSLSIGGAFRPGIAGIIQETDTEDSRSPAKALATLKERRAEKRKKATPNLSNCLLRELIFFIAGSAFIITLPYATNGTPNGQARGT